MSKAPTKSYPAACKERAVKLARRIGVNRLRRRPATLGVNENTLHTWIGKYHRAERQEKAGQ